MRNLLQLGNIGSIKYVFIYIFSWNWSFSGYQNFWIMLIWNKNTILCLPTQHCICWSITIQSDWYRCIVNCPWDLTSAPHFLFLSFFIWFRSLMRQRLFIVTLVSTLGWSNNLVLLYRSRSQLNLATIMISIRPWISWDSINSTINAAVSCCNSWHILAALFVVSTVLERKGFCCSCRLWDLTNVTRRSNFANYFDIRHICCCLFMLNWVLERGSSKTDLLMVT